MKPLLNFLINRLSLAALCLLAGCQPAQPPSPIAFQETVMTVGYRILVGSTLTPEQKLQIQAIISQTFEEINNTYNKWNPHSEISQLNALQANETRLLSPNLFHFLQKADTLVKLTEGRFDPTVEPLQQLWKSRLENNQLPGRADVESLKPCLGWDKIHFQTGLFYKDDSRTQLDLGGIAKGLCVDLLIERLNQAGFPNLYVEWGGDIRTSGMHPQNRPWNIYISRLADSDPGRAIDYVSLKDQAIATSGDYHQYWSITQGDRPLTYCHIFNPLTFSPLQVQKGSVASASLVADDCFTADGLAKVMMLFDSREEAENWIKKTQKTIPHLSYWIVTR